MADNNTKDIEPENTGKIRNKKGQFVPGISGNPKGKPLGAVSIVAKIKEKLKDVPEGQKATYLELLVNRYFKLAIQDGDTTIIKDIINRIDGMPIQSTDITSFGEKLEQLIIYKPERLKKELDE